MKMRRIMVLAVMAFVIVGLLGLPALAEKGGQGKGKGQSGGDSPPASASGGDTQGSSDSNPDGGGVDKPYAADGQPAGSQGPGYHDGNNGCGQDKKSGEARETGTTHTGWDDNNGWCGKPNGKTKPKPSPTTSPSPSPTTSPIVLGTSVTPSPTPTINATLLTINQQPNLTAPRTPARVLGVRIVRPAFIRMAGTGTPDGVEVLGVKFVRGEALPVTGIPAVAIAILAAALIGTGMWIRRSGRKVVVG